MPDRKPHKQRTIEKIQNAKVLDRLIKHFNGDVQLSATQVNVGLSLIKKYIPDLKGIEHSGETVTKVEVNAKSAKNITDAVRSRLTK